MTLTQKAVGCIQLLDAQTSSSAVTQRECTMSVWNLVSCCTTVWKLAFHKTCNRWMTFKVIQGH